MEYQKYLKYKTKYLQLKAKLTQLGGAPRWNVNVAPITPEESKYIQQKYVAGFSNSFEIPSPYSTQGYKYKLDIDKGTGVRINITGNTVKIENKDGSGWKINVTPITQTESQYIQQQYVTNKSNFTIPQPYSSQEYKYKLDIGKSIGERINKTGNTVKIIQTNDSTATSLSVMPSSAMPSSAMPSSAMLSPGGHAMSSEFQEYGREASSLPQEPPSKPIPSYNITQAKKIIKKYVKEFINGKKILHESEYMEIYAAKEALRVIQDEAAYSWNVIQFQIMTKEIYDKKKYDEIYFNKVLEILSNY
jgi:hypothetical protein